MKFLFFLKTTQFHELFNNPTLGLVFLLVIPFSGRALPCDQPPKNLNRFEENSINSRLFTTTRKDTFELTLRLC